jgi:hypothetical protein
MTIAWVNSGKRAVDVLVLGARGPAPPAVAEVQDVVVAGRLCPHLLHVFVEVARKAHVVLEHEHVAVVVLHGVLPHEEVTQAAPDHAVWAGLLDASWDVLVQYTLCQPRHVDPGEALERDAYLRSFHAHFLQAMRVFGHVYHVHVVDVCVHARATALLFTPVAAALLPAPHGGMYAAGRLARLPVHKTRAAGGCLLAAG